MKTFSTHKTLLVGCLTIGSVATAFAQGGTWMTRTSMPSPRSHVAVGEVNGTLYAVGGLKDSPIPSADPFIATVDAYDPLTDMWTTKTSMPTPRADLGVGTVNGILYAVGGNNIHNFSGMATVEAYNPSTDMWTTKASMPTARYGLGVVVINGLLYAVGGVSDAGNLATLEAYDPMTNSWLTKSPMATPRGRLAAGVVNGLLYVLGGGDSSGCLATVESYDPSTDTWSTRSPMLIARNTFGAGTVNSVLYAVGGAQNCSAAGVTGELEAYDSITGVWTTAPPMPTARFGVGVSAVNGVLFAMGGTTDDIGAFNAVEAFTPAVGPPTNKRQCKSNGWQLFDTPRRFRSQGDCIQFVSTGN